MKQASSPALGLAALLLFSLPSCGGAEDPEQTTQSGELPAGLSEEQQALFETAAVQASSEIEDELSRRDAKLDGWDTEIMHDRAKVALKNWVKHLVDPKYSFEKIGKDVSADFRGDAEFVNAELESVFDHQGIEVKRPVQVGEAVGFQEFAAAYREAFAAADEIHPGVKIFGVERMEGNRFATKAYVQTHAQQGDQQWQLNHVWNVIWEDRGEDQELAVAGIESQSYEEFRSPKAILADKTESVFGGFDFFEDEFLLGAGDWYRRKDRLTGNSYMGWQGIAVGDVDGNGLEDLYVCQPGGLPNRLFLRQEDGSVTETAREAQVAFLDNTRGALLLDLDNDGDQDLVVSVGPNLVVGYNDGKGRFPNLLPLTRRDSAFVHGITAADVDRDGDLDLYACAYNMNGDAGALGGGLPVPYHDADNGGRNALFRNDGVGKFVDVTVEWGLDENNTKFSLAAVFEDYDEDGDLDLYVTNDFGRNNYYRNDDGRFSDVVNEVGLGELAASMGATVADYDKDGDMDIYLSNMFSSAGLRIVTQADQWRPDEREEAADFISHARGNFMLENQGDGTFVDTTHLAGVELGRWTWGARFVDFDNDGFDDLYVPNGFVTGPDTSDL